MEILSVICSLNFTDMRFFGILFLFAVATAQHKKKSVNYPAEPHEESYEINGPSSVRPGPRPVAPGPQPVFPPSSRPPLIIPSTSPPLVLPPLPPSPRPVSPSPFPPSPLPPVSPQFPQESFSPGPFPPSPLPPVSPQFPQEPFSPGPFPPSPLPPVSPQFPQEPFSPGPFPPSPLPPISPQFPQEPLPPTTRPETEPGNLDIYEVMPAGEMAQLVAIDVECAMTSMRIRVAFDRPFNGVIYSKGFFADPACHYVPWGSNQPEYEFEVTLDRCGTQFIDNLASGGTANLEAILLVQNEPNVQEMWDLARRVQCTWQGQVDQTVSTGFQVDMLDTLAVAYSGDDVSAEMDIQVGRGPFAQRAEGLLKIGEPLTVVIYVFGSGDMDVHVRDCIAHDGDRANALQLTDEHGCNVKKKLIGAWRFTRETGTTGASIIAYANMQSFRFPDKTDVYLECGLDICKGECPDYCPEYPTIDYRSFPRPKRSVDHQPRDAILVRTLRIMDESVDANTTFLLVENSSSGRGEFCISTVGFTLGLVILVAITLVAILSSIIFWFRIKTINRVDSTPCAKLRW